MWQTGDSIHILLMTALDKEYTSLQILLENYGVTEGYASLGRKYNIISVKNKHDIYVNIGTTCVGKMGRLSTALATKDAILSLNPEFIIMTGIAAALPNSPFNLFDVAISEIIFDYSLKKYKNGEKEFRVDQYECSRDLVDLAKSIDDNKWKMHIPQEVVYGALGSRKLAPVSRIANIACGDSVIADSTYAQEILIKTTSGTHEKPSVIEMESAGVAAAINSLHTIQKPNFIMLKGISDHAGEDKADGPQPLAAITSAALAKELLNKLCDKYIQPEGTTTRPKKRQPIVTLRPWDTLKSMYSEFPQDICGGWSERMIDGAIEVVRFTQPGNIYGGIRRDDLTCNFEDVEWPFNLDIKELDRKLDKLSIGFTGDKDTAVNGWLDHTHKNAEPNRIVFLLNSPDQSVLDKTKSALVFGNSDYFTVRTIQETSKLIRNKILPSDHLKQIFPNRWIKGGERFPAECIPYHVSAQGIIINKDPETRKEHIILASVNPQIKTLVYGWGATMAEQMWAPEPKRSFDPWWYNYLGGYQIKQRKERQGDKHLTDTLNRGLEEEFRLQGGIDYDPDPPLLNACIEVDMYFLTFIYLVKTKLPILTLYNKWKNANDPEINLLAAYQIAGELDGVTLNPSLRLAELLKNDKFDSSQHLLPNINQQIPPIEWHPSSKMRIYAAGMHLYGEEFEDLVTVEF